MFIKTCWASRLGVPASYMSLPCVHCLVISSGSATVALKFSSQKLSFNFPNLIISSAIFHAPAPTSYLHPKLSNSIILANILGGANFPFVIITSVGSGNITVKVST
jgi:hypothetical protein